MSTIKSNIDWKAAGFRIRMRRTELMLSQEQIAEAIGLSASHFSRIELGRSCSLDVFYRICRALQTSADELLGLPYLGDSLSDEMLNLVRNQPLAEKALLVEVMKQVISLTDYVRGRKYPSPLAKYKPKTDPIPKAVFTAPSQDGPAHMEKELHKGSEYLVAAEGPFPYGDDLK